MKNLQLLKLNKTQVKNHIFEKDIHYAQNQVIFFIKNHLEKTNISPALQFEISFQKCKKLGVLK